MTTPDKRIAWLCENVAAFKAAYEAAEKARIETEDNRKRMAQHMSAAALAKYSKPERAA